MEIALLTVDVHVLNEESLFVKSINQDQTTL